MEYKKYQDMTRSQSGNPFEFKELKNKCMQFEFPGRKWAFVTFILMWVVGGGLYFVSNQTKYPELIQIIGAVFFLFFLFSTFYSFFRYKSVYIDGNTQLVRYSNKYLFKEKSWQRSFYDFKELQVSRPPFCSGPGAGRSTPFYLVSLVDQDQDQLSMNFGYNLIGTWGIKHARKLADELGNLMHLPVIDKT